MTTLREKLIRIGAKSLSQKVCRGFATRVFHRWETGATGVDGIGSNTFQHAKYITFKMAEVAAPHVLFAAILERLERFAVLLPLVRPG